MVFIMKFIAASCLVLLLSVNAYALNFQIIKGPLSDFAEWVSEQTDANIILGRGVEGNISFYTRDLAPDQVLDFFDMVMDAYDYDCIHDGNSVSVVTRREQEERDGEPPIPTIDARLYHLGHVLSTDCLDQVSFLVTNLSDDRTKSAVKTVVGNNLLVLASKDIHQVVGSLLNDMDQEKNTLIVEAIIFEYQKSKVVDKGLALEVGKYSNGAFSAFNSSDLVDLASLPAGLVASFIKADSFAGLVRAIETNDHSKLLSTPKILVVDGGSGRISVGQNVPFVTGSTTDSDGEPYQTIERKDIGTILSITPKVIGPDLIQLAVSQESSNVTTETFASDIITNTRSITTNVQVKPGQVIQLGGLVSSDTSDTVSKVPFFSKIPLLGRLFRSTSNDDRQVELTVFLRVKFV